MVTEYRTRQWDSEFFGINVVEIITPDIDDQTFELLINKVRKRGAELVYWPSPRMLPANLTDAYGGQLVDVKITLQADLNKIAPLHPTSTVDDIVVPCHPDTPTNAFDSLARQAGEFSRFSVDPNIPAVKFQKLYEIWAQKSLSKEMADEVLVIYHNQQPAGFITLIKEEEQGKIGLIAVDQSCRGKRYGEKLVRAAQRWFLQQGCRHGRVVTQENNSIALNLYEKCGYTVEKTEYFYHFWL